MTKPDIAKAFSNGEFERTKHTLNKIAEGNKVVVNGTAEFLKLTC